MNHWRHPHLNPLAGSCPLKPATAIGLGQRLGQIPAVESDQAFTHALEASNQLPIPNDLAISIVIPNEKTAGCAPQKWAAPLSEQIRRLASRIDRDRQVCELHIHIDQRRPITTLIQHLIDQVESHFTVAESAVLSLFAPAGVNERDVLADKTAFSRVHLDYFYTTADDLETSIAAGSSRQSGQTSRGITLKPCLDSILQDAPMMTWLPQLLDQHPDRLSLECLQPTPDGYRNLLYTHPDAKFGIDQLKTYGYHIIGGGTFVKPACPLAEAYQHQRLGLGLDGYLTQPSLDQLGLGPQAMSWLGDYVAINHTNADLYHRIVQKGQLPVAQGFQLHLEDQIKQAVIDAFICEHALSIDKIQRRFLICFKKYFPEEYEALTTCIDAGLLSWHSLDLDVTDVGLTYLTNIVSPFSGAVDFSHSVQPSIVHLS